MTGLWSLCGHGFTKGHWISHYPSAPDDFCPGGHVATVEEVVEWLKGSAEGEQALHEATCEYCRSVL